MQIRIKERLGIHVEVKTFHKLGLEIISAHSNRKPDIEDVIGDIINDYFRSHILTNAEMTRVLLEFFGCYLYLPKNLDDFESLGDCHDHYRNFDFTTLKGKYENFGTEKRK